MPNLIVNDPVKNDNFFRLMADSKSGMKIPLFDIFSAKILKTSEGHKYAKYNKNYIDTPYIGAVDNFSSTIRLEHLLFKESETQKNIAFR